MQIFAQRDLFTSDFDHQMLAFLKKSWKNVFLTYSLCFTATLESMI